MVVTTWLRILRRRYRIPLVELAEKMGISNQHLSRIELGIVAVRPWQEERIATALEDLIADKTSNLLTMERDYLLYKGRLLEPVEVESDES